MEIRRYESDLLSSNMYLIVENKKAIVIDPSRDISLAGNLQIDKIILTHEHYDHISGVNIWKKYTGAHVLCSASCAENIISSKKNMSHLFDAFCELQTWIKLEKIPEADLDYTCRADETFIDQMEFVWQGHQLLLFEIPGHSQGSIGLLLDHKYFFSGDSLMENQEIELRLPGGSKKQWQSVGKPRIAALPDGITVYPGHFKDFICNRGDG